MPVQDRAIDVRRTAVALAPAALVVAWSSGFVGAELAQRAGLHPFTVLGWRFVVVATVLLGACAVTKTSLRSWAAWRRQAAIGVLCQVIYLAFIFEGVSRGVHGGTTALIAALQPLLVVSVAGRLLGESSTRATWIGTMLGFVGVVIVVSGDLHTDGAPAWAYALPLVGMLSLTAGTVLARRLDPPETLLQTITMQSVITTGSMLLAALIAGQAAPPTTADAWIAIGWLVLFASFAGYGLYVFVNRTAGATTVSTMLYLTPPATMLWTFLMFGEPITLVGVAGLLVSAIGVALVLRARTPTAGARMDHERTKAH